jgi:hypothetical protein
MNTLNLAQNHFLSLPDMASPHNSLLLHMEHLYLSLYFRNQYSNPVGVNKSLGATTVKLKF